MTAVAIEHVGHRYGTMRVLQDITLELAEGEVLGLFGHNGAGKTTLMKLILGLLTPSDGKVRVLGASPQDAHVRGRLGYLPENVSFYPQLTGDETLRHFARLKGASPTQVSQLLEQVGLAEAAKRRVRTYSKGMRQRLGVAQALLGSPRLLLLDEPTVGLDPIATQALYQLVDTLRQQGTSIILCSHVLPGVERHINRIAILAKGQLQALGSLGELRQMADLPVRIRATGELSAAQWLTHLRHTGHDARQLDADTVEVQVPHGQKAPVLRELLGDPSLSDLDIHAPSLEDLYCYFMRRADVPSPELTS